MTPRELLRIATRRALMPVWAALLALLVLLPSLSGPGLWEPHEMKVADQAAARADRDPDAADDAARPAPPGSRPDCPKQPDDDAGARTLTTRLAAVGLADVGSSEGGMRLLLAGLAFLGVLASYGIAARLGSPRAGLFTAAVLLSFPLLVLQARQLTSEIGSAAGATLLVYGLVAAARPARWPWAALDLAVSALATVGGAAIAFYGGGALIGLVPPLVAVALAGGFGLLLAVAAARLAYQAEVHAVGRVAPRRAIGRRKPYRAAAGIGARDAMLGGVALLALVGLVVAGVALFDEIYDVQDRAPGTREILGKSFVATECWSDALGGIWRAHDDVRSTYDSMFEQIAFGMFPWSVLAPVALLGLAMGHGGDDRRLVGRLTVAWAGAAWIAGTVFERKVGFALYAGFPACAIAIGTWIDGHLAAREAATTREEIERERTAGLLVGLWVLLGMIAIAKDLQTFPEKLTSLLVGDDQIKYPAVKLLGLKLRVWLLALALLTAGAFCAGTWLWQPRGAGSDAQHPARRLAARWGIPVALVLAVITGIFWAQGWQRTLSKALSSKHIFSVYQDLRKEGDVLGIMGDMGNAPRYYGGGEWETIKGREGLLAFLQRPERVFALAPAGELCAIHRSFAGKPYYVLDDSNARFMLLSNRLDGATDKNPVSKTILRTEPEGIKTRFSATFDDRIELIGYTMPRRVSLGAKFEMTLYFRVKKPVSGSWKIFVHFDKPGMPRFQGDHDPIRGRCATSFWQEGDYIVDTFEVEAGDITSQSGNYRVLIGFFTGTSPNWKNMKVTQAPKGAKDDADRVLLGTIEVD